MDSLQPARFVLDRIDTRILTELQHDATIPIAVLRLGGPADYLLRVLVADTQSIDGFYQRLVAGVTLRAVTSKFVMEVAHSNLGLPIASD